MQSILELKTRRTIYQCILKNPGLHQSELSRKVNVPLTTLRYHLRRLKKRNLIIEKHEVGFIRFYAINNVSNKNKELLEILHHKTYRYIILILLWYWVSTTTEISKVLQKDPTTIASHIDKLRKLGIIESVRIDQNGIIRIGKTEIIRPPIGRQVIYRIREGKGLLLWDLLITYQNSFRDDPITEDFLSIINEGVNTGLKKKSKGFSFFLDSFIENVHEIFPHPYYV